MAVNAQDAGDKSLSAARESELQDELKQVLRRRSSEAVRDAIARGGEVPSGTADQLRDLATLLETYDQTHAKGRTWLPEAILVAVIALIVVWLHFTQVESLHVDLRVKTAEVSFDALQQWELSDHGKPLIVSAIGGLNAARLPPASASTVLSSRVMPLSIEALPRPGRRASLLADPITVPPPVRISIRRRAASTGFDIILDGQRVAFNVTARGRIAISGAREATLEYMRPRVVRVASDSVLTLTLGGSADSLRIVSLPISAERLRLTVWDDFAARSGGDQRPLSSVLSGTVHHGLGDDAGRIDISEGVSFGTSRGEVVRLALADSAIHLRFRGTVTKMEDMAGRSLMPSRLEWMRLYERRYLLTGTVISIVSALLLVVRRVGLVSG